MQDQDDEHVIVMNVSLSIYCKWFLFNLTTHHQILKGFPKETFWKCWPILQFSVNQVFPAGWVNCLKDGLWFLQQAFYRLDVVCCLITLTHHTPF